MPLYEYRCDNCGERFEVMQKFSDPPLTTHAQCGGPVERLLSAPALQFKGSGWYITDYARGGGAKNSGADKKSDGKPSESKSESKSESSSSSTPATPTATPKKD